MVKTFLIRREEFRAALVCSLLAQLDSRDSPSPETHAFVSDRLARVGGITRVVIQGVEAILSTTFSAAASVGSSRTEKLLRRVGATTLPAIADYVRLVRSLVLIFTYEARSSAAVEARHSR
jgi:hypothetical protein